MSPKSAMVWHAPLCLELLDPTLPMFSSAYWSSLPLKNAESMDVNQFLKINFEMIGKGLS